MADFKIKVDGLASLQEKLMELEAEVAQRQLQSAARQAMVPVRDDAKSLVPVDSGALRDAITISSGKPASGDTVVVSGLRIGTSKLQKQAKIARAVFGGEKSKELPPSSRWHFIELGTSKMAARPFLRPALERNVGRIIDILKAAIQAGIDRVTKGNT